jgi:hypothetical protein
MKEKLWRPSSLPWRAERKEIDGSKWVWYVIYDSHGAEIFTTEKMESWDDHQIRAEVALVLMTVNKSRTITIDKKQIEITWMGESNGERNKPGTGVIDRSGHIPGQIAEFAGTDTT